MNKNVLQGLREVYGDMKSSMEEIENKTAEYFVFQGFMDMLIFLESRHETVEDGLDFETPTEPVKGFFLSRWIEDWEESKKVNNS